MSRGLSLRMSSSAGVMTEDVICKELTEVQRQAGRTIDQLSLRDNDHTGLEILHLFIVDVLGRDSSAAKIFESKLGQDFKEVTVVSVSAKALCWCGIVVINFFFVYYVLIHSYMKGATTIIGVNA